MIKNMILSMITIIAVITLFAAVAFADGLATQTLLTAITLSGGWIILFCYANGI